MKCEKITLYISISLLNLCLGLVAPFLPAEAKKKGFSPMYFCLFFAAFSLARIFSSNALLYMMKTGKISFTMLIHMGSVTIAACTIGIGVLQFVKCPRIFFALGITMRMVSGIACTVLTFGLLRYVLCFMPTRAGFAMSLGDYLSGLVYVTAVPLFGYIQEVSDFYVPFVAVGLFSLCVALASFLIITTIKPSPIIICEPAPLLRLPSAFTSVVLMFFSELSCMYMRVLMEISVTNLVPNTFAAVGGIFAANKFAYYLAAQIASRLIKNMDVMTASVTSGLILKCFTFLLWSSPDFLPNKQSIGQIAAVSVTSGLADGLLKTGSFVMLKQTAFTHNLADNLWTNGTVLCVFLFATQFGAVLGALLAGMLDTIVGPPKAAVVMMGIFICLTLVSPLCIEERTMETKVALHQRYMRNPIVNRNAPTWEVYNSSQLRDALSYTSLSSSVRLLSVARFMFDRMPQSSRNVGVRSWSGRSFQDRQSSIADAGPSASRRASIAGLQESPSLWNLQPPTPARKTSSQSIATHTSLE